MDIENSEPYHICRIININVCSGLNMLGPGNDIVMRCDLMGVGVALSEEVCLLVELVVDSPPRCLEDSLLETVCSRCRILSSFYSNMATCMLLCFFP